MPILPLPDEGRRARPKESENAVLQMPQLWLLRHVFIMTHSQVLILNPKLSKQLCASLGARASVQAYINYIDSQDVRLWLAQGSNIVALAGGSAIELRELYNRATLHSMFVSEIYLDDKLVAVAIGPHVNESIKPLIKHLKML